LELGELAKRFPTNECCHPRTSLLFAKLYFSKA
jgi:hypothetical protein